MKKKYLILTLLVLISISLFADCYADLDAALDRADAEYADDKRLCRRVSQTIGVIDGFMCSSEAEIVWDRAYSAALSAYQNCQ